MYTLKEAYLLAKPGQYFKPKGNSLTRGEYYQKQFNGTLEVIVEGGSVGYQMSIHDILHSIILKEHTMDIYGIYEDECALRANIHLE